jgi:hypothetical protein
MWKSEKRGHIWRHRGEATGEKYFCGRLCTEEMQVAVNRVQKRNVVL